MIITHCKIQHVSVEPDKCV